jgi:hypothetical protein
MLGRKVGELNQGSYLMEKSKAIERANSYRQMVGLWAWKDFEKEILEIENEASRKIDTVVLDQNAGMVIAEARGERKSLQKLYDRINYILGEGGISAEQKL